jgi:hypothetical protein
MSNREVAMSKRMGKKSYMWFSFVVLALCIANTTFAASPFIKVPAGHWAYGSIEKLAQAGIVDSYDDSTSRSKKTLTRYAMAMIVAEAMANEDDVNAEQKAEIEKLATEFKSELENLGVSPSLSVYTVHCPLWQVLSEDMWPTV